MKRTSVGGQALLEGMLMIGPRKAAIAIRKPDKTIELKVQDLPKKMAVQKIPVIRGAVNMVRQLVLGFRALMFSAEFFDIEDEAEAEAAKPGDEAADGVKQAKSEPGAEPESGAAPEPGEVGAGAVAGAGEAADGVKQSTSEPESKPEAASAANVGEAADAVKQAASDPEPKPESKPEAASAAKVGEAADGGKQPKAAPEPQEMSRFERFLEERFGDKSMEIFTYVAVALSLCMTIGLFILLPNALAGFLPIDRTNRVGLLVHNLFEGVIRVGVFLGFLSLSSRMKDIQRVWQYHGAEHKTIHCFEHGDALTVENIRPYSTKHPRCGTSFLFLVMAIAILVFSVMDILMSGFSSQFSGIIRTLFNMGVRLVTIPIVAGLAFEAVKFTGRRDSALTKIISAPGLLFQQFTTKEPDDGMLEVAIVAFENAVSDDEREMAW